MEELSSRKEVRLLHYLFNKEIDHNCCVVIFVLNGKSLKMAVTEPFMVLLERLILDGMPTPIFASRTNQFLGCMQECIKMRMEM